MRAEVLVFQDGDRLAYVNPRRIGHVRLVDSAEAFIAETSLGPDALDPSLDEAAFAALLAGRRQPIKAVLMDQARVAGIGTSMPMRSCSTRGCIRAFPPAR